MELPCTEQAIAAPILVVDDQPANLLAIEAILAPAGHELVRASSGEEALRALLEREFAVILLDVQMPGMDGFETAALVKARPRTKHIPIIFVTAVSRDASHIFQGYEAGAVDYLLKPINPDVLRSKVAVFVELFRKNELLKRQEAQLRLNELEEAERRSELRFRSLFDSMPLCVWTADAQGRATYRNGVARDYLGCAADGGANSPGWEAIHPDDREAVRKAWQTTIQNGTPFELPYRLRRNSDGAYRWHLSRAVPNANPSAQAKWIVTATDIDDQKRVEAEYMQLSEQEQQARKVAEQASRAKDEFLATVSHELRTPLTAILGWSAMLSSNASDPAKLQRAVSIIERNARSQRDLIEDLLDMSRIESGKLQLSVGEVDIDAVVSRALESLKPAAEARKVTLATNTQGESALLRADAERLQQIVWNLVSNAIKFSCEGGRIELAISHSPEQVRLAVRDQGCGIPKEFLPFVFERFRQADGTSTRTSGGLGIGLSIVRHLAELHGGTISAHSDGPGTGATFEVVLPRCMPQRLADEAIEEEHGEPVHPGTAQALQDIRVLLVEDDPDGREVLAMMLEELGAEVHAVGSAEDALAALPTHRPHVLVSDLGLPRTDGFALIRQIRQLPAAAGGNIPAAALSAYATADDARRATDAGFQTHVAKPAESATLAQVVSELANGASLH